MTAKSHRTSMHKRQFALYKGANRAYWAMCTIPLLFIILFNYIPMFGIVIAFKNYKFNKGIFGSEWIGFENFRLFIKSNDFFRITRNTLVLNFMFIILGIIAAVALALALFEITSRAKTKLYQTVLITPNFISWVIVAYMVYAVLEPRHGLANQLLGTFGIDAIEWYSEPDKWPGILAICYLWKSVGMDSIIYYATLMAIDTSYFEAARIDGANRWQTTTRITLPCLTTIIMINVILKIGGIFRADFGLFYQVTRDVGTLYPTTDVIDTYIFRVMREMGNMSLSAAVGVMQSVVGFAVVMITNWVTRKINPENALF